MRRSFDSYATFSLLALATGFALAACSDSATPSEGTGGAAASAGTATAGTGGTAGTAGTGGNGGSAMGGAAGADAGSSAGGAAGAGASGGDGMGGAAGAGAMGGAAGAGAIGGAGGAGAMGGGAGSTSVGGAGSGDSFVTGVNVEMHDEVRTILVVTWTQMVAADSVFLEFTFESGNVMTSRPQPGAAGAHRDVVLGAPGDTPVTIRIVSRVGNVDNKTMDYMGTTGAVPAGMPRPIVMDYDPARASPDRWMFGAVEDSTGGCTSTSCYYHTTFWLYIIDRQGRIVWYYSDPSSDATSSFQRIARDGRYIWIEKRPFTSAGGSRTVLKRSLDGEYSEEIPVPNLSDCIDVTDDGALLYDAQNTLREMNAAGQHRTIWNCRNHFGQGFQCYSNTVNWNPLDDTVLMSFPEERTVIEINRATGAVVGQYGAAPGSYAFQRAATGSVLPQGQTWGFGYQHFANISMDGTLMVSSHMPGYENTRMPVAGQHAFKEFTIDRQNETLIEKWVYNGVGRDEGQEWAMFKGMTIRLPNGNTLGNYGTGGVIREITPDKETVFYVKFDAPAGSSGNDFFNKMVGHNVLVNDLYLMNGSGPEP